MTRTDGWRRLAARGSGGEVLLFDPAEVYYLEADAHDTLVRTARRAPYRSTLRLHALGQRLPRPPFFRCHSAFVVNLDRVRSVERRGRDYALRLDPPVNRILPLARGRVAALRRLIGEF